MPSRRVSRRGICVAARDATALIALLAVAGLLAAAAAQAVTLPPPHLGVALTAPAAPTVGGSPPTSVAYSWRRCNRYTSLVKIDGAADFWQLGADAGTTAPDFIGTAPGRLLARRPRERHRRRARRARPTRRRRSTATSDSISVAGAPERGRSRAVHGRGLGAAARRRRDTALHLRPRDRLRHPPGHGPLAVDRRPRLRALDERREDRRHRSAPACRCTPGAS